MIKPIDRMKSLGKEILLKEYELAQENFMHMDLFGYTPNKQCCEIEIKVACYDFNKEFTKESKLKKHAGYIRASIEGFGWCPNMFYFFVLSNITKKVLDRIDKVGYPYGVIEYNSLKDTVNIIRKSPKLSNKDIVERINI